MNLDPVLTPVRALPTRGIERLAEAAWRVSVQADCSIDHSVALMRERAALTHRTLDSVVVAVNAHRMWFGT